MSHNVQRYDRAVYLRVAEAQVSALLLQQESEGQQQPGGEPLSCDLPPVPAPVPAPPPAGMTPCALPRP